VVTRELITTNCPSTSPACDRSKDLDYASSSKWGGELCEAQESWPQVMGAARVTHGLSNFGVSCIGYLQIQWFRVHHHVFPIKKCKFGKIHSNLKKSHGSSCFLFPITVAKDQSGGRVDRLFGQLGAQQCPGGENAVKPQLFFALMSKLSFKDAYDNL
jgi:hypothetical protein